MRSKNQSDTSSNHSAVAVLAPVRRPDRVGTKVQMYGWDMQSRTWHGPSELTLAGAHSYRLAQSLRKAPGPSWFGPMICAAPGEPTARFFLVTHALKDCGVAMIYCGESKAGPVEIMAVIPPERRSRLRPEFTFEFLTFAGFLGSFGNGAELEISEGIGSALEEISGSDSLVFSINTGLWTGDLDCILSRCVEQTIVAVLRWMHRPD